MSSSNTWVPRKKVAIVGGGSAGIAALWALNRTHHDAYMYEAADRLGGHTNTVEWKAGKFRTMVDTGFVVFNPETYPNLTNFFKRVNVPVTPTDVSLAVSRDHGVFEWATSSLNAVFSQRWNLFSIRMWRLMFDIVRFNQFAVDLLKQEDEIYSPSTEAGETIRGYLDRGRYSDTFRNDYLIPRIASVWCTGPEEGALDLPAVTFVRFMRSHHLLSTTPGSKWLTLEGGSRSYVDAVMRGFPPNHLFLKTPITHLTNDEDGRIRLHTASGKTEVYDHVILATHGDQAYRIVAPSATEEEESILTAFRSCEHRCVLHSDVSQMPKNRKAWSGLNCTSVSSPWTYTNVKRVSLTYNMNLVQHIPREPFGDVLVTINPLREPKPETVQGRYLYSHPVYDAVAVRAQQALPRIQNTRGISYAGAWTSYGSHEDGFTSGLHAAKAHLGARLPFDLVEPRSVEEELKARHKIHRGVQDLVLRLFILVIQVLVVDVLDRALRVPRQRMAVRAAAAAANGNGNGNGSGSKRGGGGDGDGDGDGKPLCAGNSDRRLYGTTSQVVH
ncbi:Cytochrome c oxidase assembly protein cox11, mitochondrial [Diatrype stigma]|uniref:Cytochrome c oxidase assembly protein cox11, mitochondrial n=1 Tax=Diatrype stigma TaxID=117547 RepID=A0AAN9UTV9_9PEZI